MAYTADDLARIDRAISDGALMVTLADGSSTRYRDMDELLRVRALIQSDLRASEGRAPRRRSVVTHTDKGAW